MKGGKSKSRANRSDTKLCVRNGVGKAATGLIPPTRPPLPLTDFRAFFWNTFRDQFKAKYPTNKSFVDIRAAARVEWDTMSDADKAPYVDFAEKSTEEYVKLCAEYKKRMEEYTCAYKAAEKASEEVQQSLAGLVIRQ